MNNTAVTATQLDLMKHCIGFTPDKVRGRGIKRYKAYRNWFTSGDTDPEWEELISLGLAQSRKHHAGGGDNPQWYSLTEAGMQLVARMTGVLITNKE